MKTSTVISAVLAIGLVVGTSSALAAKANDTAKAEKAMLDACHKDYAKETKGKSFKDVAAWVENEERGANAETFKKSKCYDLHEKWEGVAGHHEEGEEHEHKM